MTAPTASTDADVIRIAREHRAALLSNEQAAMEDMTRRWVSMARNFEDAIDLLAIDIDQRRAAGRPVTPGQIYRLERYENLLDQMRTEIERYNDIADAIIADAQGVSAALGGESAAQMIALQYGGAFDMLPLEALEVLAGFTQDGAPLTDLLQEAYPDAVDGVNRAIEQGILRGWGPDRMAREMVRGTSYGLNRALVIARDQTMRINREAARRQFEASGVVVYHKRLATRDARTCMGCILLDGERLEVDEVVYDHPNGRCTSVPVVDGRPEVQWQNARDWFMEQPPEAQAQQMGPGRWAAWQRGDFQLDDLLRIPDDPRWGRSVQSQALHRLLRGADTDPEAETE